MRFMDIYGDMSGTVYKAKTECPDRVSRQSVQVKITPIEQFIGTLDKSL